MKFASLSRLELPPTLDFRCHLRQGKVMKLCTFFVKKGGYDVAYIMLNTIPPLKTMSDALLFYEKLLRLAPDLVFVMTGFSPSGFDSWSDCGSC